MDAELYKIWQVIDSISERLEKVEIALSEAGIDVDQYSDPEEEEKA